MTSQATAEAARAPGHPFDAAADGYDAAFTNTRLGRWLRAEVWQELDRCFTTSDSILELGCGTGEDAVHLARRGVHVVATDASSAMLDVAREKARRSEVSSLLEFVRFDLRDLSGAFSVPSLAPTATGHTPFDGAFSSFGPLNCIEDRTCLARALHTVIKPGGKLVLVIMGPVCPWEIGWHLARRDPATALRRLRIESRARIERAGDLQVWYPSIGRLRDEMQPFFRMVRVKGLGTLVPPSDMGRIVDRFPRLFHALWQIDRRLSRSPVLRDLADHYMMVLERQP